MKKAMQRLQYGMLAGVFALAVGFSSLVGIVPTQVVYAAGETLTAVGDLNGKPGQDVAITGLQVNGTGDDEITVGLHVDGGELWFNNYGAVNFEDSSYGTYIRMSGTRSEVNYALANLMFTGDDEDTYAVEITLGDGNYNSENGHVYQVIPAPGISWTDARDDAQELEYGGVNGYLATITSEAEHNFIRERINDSGWIGATDAGDEGIWRWVVGPEGQESEGDGRQFWTGDEEGSAYNEEYSNWNPSEPNNSGESGEDCAQIWFTEDSDGLWNDLDCNSEENEYYVVEFGGSTEETLPVIESTTFDITLARDTVQVDSCDELFELGPERAGDIIELTADIDCQGRTEGPLFDEEDFSGYFEGNGFTIKNLVIADDDGEHIGLTGYSYGAEFHNLFLDNITLEAAYHSGILAGHVEDSIVAQNIHATNIHMTDMPGADDNEGVTEIGVLFGAIDTLEHQNGQSIIEHVSVQGTFDITNNNVIEKVGGIAGYIDVENDFVMEQVYADVDININSPAPEEGYLDSVGGLVGAFRTNLEDDNADKDVLQGIRDSYSWGSINAPNGFGVGGLVGSIDNDTEDDADLTFLIENSYSWMNIDGAEIVGGLVGYIQEIGDFYDSSYSYVINDSFYAGTISGNSSVGTILGAFADYEEEYATFEFDNVWFDEGKNPTYPCVDNMIMDECHVVNGENSNPNYFINNNTNAPMNQWDFETIWKTQSGTPPVFKPFIGNDGDQDGANDYIEDRAPNEGDGNNDGTPDSDQAHVASFVSQETNQYVTLALDDACSITAVSVTKESTATKQDANYIYNNGLVNFAADCGSNGFTTTVTLYHFGVSKAGLTVRKYNPNTETYFTIAGASLADQVIGGQNAAVVSYQVTDGGELDTDGEANGTIVDPVGLAAVVASGSSSDLASTGQAATNYIWAIVLLLTTGVVAVVARRKQV